MILLLKVYFGTSFDLKKPKLEPQLISTLSITKCLFQLFRFYTETECFGVLIERKQTEEQPKQFDIELILVFFSENLGFFRFVSVCFGLLFIKVCFGCFASIPKQRVSMFRLNRNKPKTNQNSLKERIFWYFPENLRCFGLFWFVLKQFCLFRFFRYRFETSKQTKHFVFGFTKRNTTETDHVLVCFGSSRNFFVFFEDTLLFPPPSPICSSCRTDDATVYAPPRMLSFIRQGINKSH